MGSAGLPRAACYVCAAHMPSPQTRHAPRATARSLRGLRLTAIAVTSAALMVAGGFAAPAQASTKPTVKAPSRVITQIADTLDVEARCIKVRLARSWRAWAWVAPTYRIGCDHQLDTALIMAKQVGGDYATTGIEGASLECSTLKRQMSLYVEDEEPRIGKRTMRAFRNFKAAKICVKG